MTITQAFNTAQSGLRANSAIAGATSTNIANASTPGYVRRNSNLSSLVLSGFGSGVDVQVVRASINEFLLRDVRLENAEVAFNQAQVGGLTDYASILGQPQDPLTIANSIRNLEITFQTLFDAPNSVTTQRAVLNAAEQVAADLNRLTDAVQQQRLAADQGIQRAVDDVNSSLYRIEDLNLQILEFRAAGRQDSDLVDERDRLIDGIAEKLPIRTFERGDGELVIFTQQGVALLDGRVKELTFTGVPTVTSQQQLNDLSPAAVAPAAPFTASLSGLQVEGFEISTVSAGNQNITSGEISGLFTLRDETLVRFQEQLDALATGLIQTFQDPANDPSIAAAVPPNAGLFVDGTIAYDPAAVPPQQAGIAGRIAINAAVDPDQGGELSRLRDGIGTPAGTPGAPLDTTQIERWLDALTTADAAAFPPGTGQLDPNQTLFGFAAQLINDQQGERTRVTNILENRQVTLTVLEQRRTNEYGVNIDFETQRLLEIEQAYSANATVIEAARDMFDRLLSIRP